VFKLDNAVLESVGLGELPVNAKNAMLAHVYSTLETRVGTALAQEMTDAQLDEFESLIDGGDEAGALTWLETNFPHYKDLVASKFEELKIEIRQVAPQILAAEQNNNR
jgi:hypothetical protein